MIWRVIPGFPSYAVSPHGQVKRIAGGQGARKGGILKPKKHNYGYLMYSLSENNEVHYVTAHHLVAVTYIGPPPTTKHEVAHWDGDPKNNYYKNLRWATKQENADDRDRHGRTLFGSKHQNSKLTEDMVREMRRLKAQGWTYKQLTAAFPVNYANCQSAVVGKTWSHVR